VREQAVVRVAHVTTTLDVGGAERALVRVATGLAARGVPQLVVSLHPAGPLATPLRAAGIPVHSVRMQPNRPVRAAFGGTARLSALLRRARPDVVQTWMYHGDLVGGLAARAAGDAVVAWNVRHSDLPLEGYGRTTALLGRVSVPASHVLPRVIVTNSVTGLEQHVARGYPRARMRTIANGVPLPTAATPDRAAARARLGLSQEAFVVGRVGRHHPQKDLPTLLGAVARVRAHHPEVVLALVGEGLDGTDPTVTRAVAAAGLTGAVHLLGRRDDAAEVPVAFDVAVSSSAYGENCPNAVLEAMAVGTPVVTTDVGDSARIVGDTGEVVAPRDPAALAAALERVLALPAQERDVLGARAAARIREGWSLERMVDRYEELYRELAAGGRGPATDG
jgi:glycosyltransferase involved in cell wall biosynthesis